jgi:hypothetical protein
MLRPTRFRLVTDSDIVPALRSCNLIKMKSSSVQIVGIPGFAPWKAPDDWLTPGLWPRLQKHPVFSLGMLPANGAALIQVPEGFSDWR